MKHNTISCLAWWMIVLPLSAECQLLSPIESLVKAEMDFAKMSVDKNTRDAFVANMDEQSIVFQEGKAVNGLSVWTPRSAGNGYLFWWPVDADIAASGDLGYTTGPAEFGPDKATRKAERGVYYSTVWRKPKDGKWKIAVDLGSSVYKPGGEKERWNERGESKKTGSRSKIDKITFLKMDHNYQEKLNGKSFMSRDFAEHGRLHRPDKDPFINGNIRKAKEDGNYSFLQVDGEVASSGDLGYVYGNVTIQSQGSTRNANYLRVWKKNGERWEIVLDVID